MTASGALEKDEKVKTAILLHTIGEEALEVYNTLTITPAGDAPTMAEILKAFRDYCSPQKNVVFERHQFWSHPMLTAITVDRYVTELRQKSKNCEFGANEDDMIRDKLVFSINDTRLKERLLRDNDLTLHKSILGGRACEELQLVKRVETVAVTSPKLTKPPATKEELVERYAEVFTGLDDMIIAATSEHEHDEILQKVMERAKAANVKFNKDKIQFKVDTVKYMGHVITAAGQKADDTKIKAIVDMPTPEDKQSLQRLLGMTKFLAQYVPNEASLTAPLRQLLKKDTVWQWQSHHTAALQTLKKTLTQAPVLRFYDHKKPLTLQADSSKDGLGACLLQEGQPVCYASRALTDTEKRYAQIEKELLAIVFATKRFHQYVYGRPVTVQSDHKPLEVIMRKPLCKAPARLQGMLLQLQRYDLAVTYTPGASWCRSCDEGTPGTGLRGRGLLMQVCSQMPLNNRPTSTTLDPWLKVVSAIGGFQMTSQPSTGQCNVNEVEGS
ncbi:hypothetical protein WMY93_025890 [Mugilogobius chulae]|uniref:ribonuclease H n=1 Tax=Mugilogobius chulae TaxID=88201 RepID=A0AAW0MXK1_9GOBI